MAMAPIDPIRLRVTSLTGKALDYLKFMTGREVRARVVRGGGTEDVLQIRMGGHLLKARLSGTALPSGRDFFVRVETMKDGSFRLVVLSGLESGAAPGSGLQAGAGPGVSPGFFRSYLAFLGAAAIQAPRKGTSDKNQAGKADLGRLDPAAQKGLLRDLLGKIAGGTGAGQELSFLGEPVDFVLMDEWRQPGGGAAQEHESSGSRKDGLDGENDQLEEEADVVGWGRREPEPASFCLRIRLPRLGTIGVMIVGPDGEFKNPSVYVTPLQPAVLRLMQEKMGEWREILAERVPGLANIALLPPEQEKSGGVDFSA